MASPSPLDYDLVQRRLHSLALRLVRDDATAEDVVQETWLAALDQPTGQVRDWTAWLGGVLRRVALGRHRKTRLRREAESRAAQADLFTEEGVRERIDTYRWLERTVGELPDPYREVLRLRFFEELSHAEIAGRLQRPLETVHSQVKRGLARMRTRMDQEHDGERRAWALLLLRHGEAPATTHAILGLRSWVLWAAGLLLGVGSWVVVSLPNPEGPSVEPETLELALTVEGNSPETDRSNPDPLSPGSIRTAVGEPKTSTVDPTPQPEASPGPAPAVLEFDVLFADGSPAPGASVYVLNEDEGVLEGVLSDRQGRVRIEVNPDWATDLSQGVHGVLVAAKGAGEAWSDNHFTPIADGVTIRGVLRLGGPAHDLDARVVDPDGQPIPGAWIRCSAQPLTVERTEDGRVVTTRRLVKLTDAEGLAALTYLPPGSFELKIRAPGYQTFTDVLVLDQADAEQTFVLHPGGRVHGRVVDPDGAPVRGTRVWVHRPGLAPLIETTTNERGAFELDGIPFGERYVFAGVESGIGARTRWTFGPEDPEPAHLTLGPIETIRLRARQRGGALPPPGAYAALFSTVNEETWFSHAFFDGEGTVSFTHYPEEPKTLVILTKEASALGRTAGEIENVGPGEYELEIESTESTAPGGRLTGSLLDHRGDPFPHAWIEFWQLGTAQLYNAALDPTTGAFEATHVLAGSYRSVFRCGALGCMPGGEFEVQDGEHVDLGSQRAEAPGAVPDRAGIHPEAEGTLEAVSAYFKSIRIGARVRASELRLLPGTYRFLPLDGSPPTEFEITH